MLKEFLLSEMIVASSTRSCLGILKYTFLTNSSCQVFLLSERIVSYKDSCRLGYDPENVVMSTSQFSRDQHDTHPEKK